MTHRRRASLSTRLGKKIAIFVGLVSIAIIVGQFRLWALDMHDHNGKPIYDAAAQGKNCTS
jgi:hypothetical protein